MVRINGIDVNAAGKSLAAYIDENDYPRMRIAVKKPF